MHSTNRITEYDERNFVRCDDEKKGQLNKQMRERERSRPTDHWIEHEQCQCIKSIYCSANILFKANDTNSTKNRNNSHNSNSNTGTGIEHPAQRQRPLPKWKQSKSHFISIFAFYLLKLIASIACRYVWTRCSQSRIDLIFFRSVEYIFESKSTTNSLRFFW